MHVVYGRGCMYPRILLRTNFTQVILRFRIERTLSVAIFIFESRIKGARHSVKLSDLTVWRHTWRRNWVNCAILTGNNARLRIVLSNRLSRRELHSSLRESHSFLSLPADTTMVSSQGASVSNNSFSRWASHDIFLFKHHFLLHILRFLFFFSDNIMADVANKQQTTALFLSTTATRTRRHTKLTKKSDKTDGKHVLCQRTCSSVFCAVFYTVILHSLTWGVWGRLDWVWIFTLRLFYQI